MKRAFFVTGTGTGVGKTFVTSRLAEQAHASGLRVFAFKPIETGCSLVNGRWVGEDQERLATAAGHWQTGELRNLYTFERPASPLAAAHDAKQSIDLDLVSRAFERGAATADVVLVEGAGGWRVPITEDADMSTLAQRLALPVLVVGSAGLGTINHTLLTIEAVVRDGVKLAAVVLSVRPDDDPRFAEENRREIARRAPMAVHLTSDPAFHVERL